MKTGIIMEGGAMRGMFTAGVTDVLMENDITFDGAIGVSAGAAFGSNLKSKQIGRAARYNLKYCRDKRYCSLRSLIFTGDYYGADFCYHQLPDKLDPFDTETFDNNPMEFYAVCTDVYTGKPVYKKCEKAGYELYEWIRASASLPLAARIVDVGGMRLLDGGISDSVPLKFFESIGYDRNIIILTQPKGYIKQKSSFIPLISVLFRKYPNIIKALKDRHNMYNETIKYICEKEEKGEVLVIRPKEALPIKRTEHTKDKLETVYETGRTVALERLDEIKNFLNIKAE